MPIRLLTSRRCTAAPFASRTTNIDTCVVYVKPEMIREWSIILSSWQRWCKSCIWPSRYRLSSFQSHYRAKTRSRVHWTCTMTKSTCYFLKTWISICNNLWSGHVLRSRAINIRCSCETFISVTLSAIFPLACSPDSHSRCFHGYWCTICSNTCKPVCCIQSPEAYNSPRTAIIRQHFWSACPSSLGYCISPQACVPVQGLWGQRLLRSLQRHVAVLLKRRFVRGSANPALFSRNGDS